MPTHSILNRLPHDLRNQRGFTLIELMISLVIGLLLSAAIVKIYADTSQIYKFQNAVSEVQENGRFASAFLRRAARLAGNFGCDAGKEISQHTLSPAQAENFFNGALPQLPQPIGGIEGATATAPDELRLRGATGGGARLDENHEDVAAPLTVESGSGITVGRRDAFGVIRETFGIISDCNSTHMFRITGPPTVVTTINHTGTTQTYTTDNGARVQEVQAVRYCIGPAAAGGDIRALKRLINPGAGENCPANGEELVEGVHNMQIQYGIVTGTPPDPLNIRYVTAPAEWHDDWALVRTLRIQLVVRSLANRITRTAVPYTLEGVDRTPAAGDLHLYKVMTSTITLRNKGT